MPAVLLVSPLVEPLTPAATRPETVHAHATVNALLRSAALHDGLELTVVASRDSVVAAPLITVDPAELGASSAASHALLIHGLALAGGLSGYDLVHCLGVGAAALQLHGASGGRGARAATDPAPAPLLPAIEALRGPIACLDLGSPASVVRALHPVDFDRVPFEEGPRSAPCAADAGTSLAGYRFEAVGSPYLLGRRRPVAVLGPRAASPFEHIVWATWSLAAGARYVHDCAALNDPVWPQGGLLHRREVASGGLEADDGLPLRLRQWALAHCSGAAAAAGLRRFYDRLIAMPEGPYRAPAKQPG